jgi:hypothetical protein
MKWTFVSIPTVALVTACAEPAMQSTEWTSGPITDEATFRQEIVGRPLTLSNERASSTVMLGPDGAFTAETMAADGETVLNRLAGSWSFRDGEFCREFRVVDGRTSSPLSECAPVSKTGNVMTIDPPGRSPSDWTVGDA